MQQLVLVTDIFGHTPQLQETLNNLKLDAVICSPYAAETYFNQEASAYEAFNQQGGVASYVDLLVEKLSSLSPEKPVLLIGFSAGAAALWHFICSEQVSRLHRDSSAWLFYGGQIRHALAKQPQINTQVYWTAESHFNVQECHQQMLSKPHVVSQILPYSHGFINPQAKGFIAHAATDFWFDVLQQLNAMKAN